MSESDASGTSNTLTNVAAGGNVSMTSGRDTNLRGAVVSGETADVTVGRDLNIETVQDTGQSSNSSVSLGIGFSGPGGNFNQQGLGGATAAGIAGLGNLSPSSVTLGGGAGSGNKNFTTGQSGIVTTGELDVYVEGNTDLVGGVIISESGDMTLDTGTLTFSDLEGNDDYEGLNLTATIGLGPDNPDADKNATTGIASTSDSLEGNYKKDDVDQEARATIGEGTIIIRDNDAQTQDVAALNRDPDEALVITKDEHIDVDIYLDDASLKLTGKVLDIAGSVIEDFVSATEAGKNLTFSEKKRISETVASVLIGQVTADQIDTCDKGIECTITARDGRQYFIPGDLVEEAQAITQEALVSEELYNGVHAQATYDDTIDGTNPADLLILGVLIAALAKIFIQENAGDGDDKDKPSEETVVGTGDPGAIPPDDEDDEKPDHQAGKSQTKYGHARSRHGSQRPAQQLKDRAKSSGNDQGHFGDNRTIVEAYSKAPSKPGVYNVTVSKPSNVYTPSGGTIKTNTVRVVIGPKGPKTAFPVIP